MKCDKIWNDNFAHCLTVRKDGVYISDMIHSCKLKKGHKGECNCSCGLVESPTSRHLPRQVTSPQRTIISEGVIKGDE